MVDTVYIERSVAQHERAQQVLDRYPKASRVDIDHYGEVFNAAKQDFRIQKQNPSLIFCLLYTSPSPRDKRQSRMPSSA